MSDLPKPEIIDNREPRNAVVKRAKPVPAMPTLKGAPDYAIGGNRILEDQRTEKQDVAARKEALKLIMKPLPSQQEVDANYFNPVPVGDPGEWLSATPGRHTPQSKLQEAYRKMMPKDWEPPPCPEPDPKDVEFLNFWELYFKESGEVPLWDDLEEYDQVHKRVYGGPRRGEKPKRSGFQVTGRFCKKPGCGGEIRRDPDAKVEQCFGCGEFIVT